MNKAFLIAAALSVAAAGQAAAFQSPTLASLSEMDGAAPDQAPAPAASPKPAGQAKAFSVFPKIVDCKGLDKQSLRFYTRLEGVKSIADLPPAGRTPASVWDGTARPDETAAQLNDYRGAAVSQKEFAYSIWSCDTQDYWFTFDTASLVRSDAATATQKVKGHVKVETRGIVDEDKDLDCTATY